MTARTTSQITEALKATLKSINQSIDLEVGPLYNYLLRPLPSEFSILENRVDHLLKFYSVDFATAATPEEARDFAINFGSGASSGGFAKGTVVFYRNSAPQAGTTYTIKVGDLVATVDRNYVFRVTQQVVINGDFAATYFNPSTNRYEVSVFVEAVAPGSTYNIPPQRITRVLANIEGVDGVEQRTSMAGGTEPETALDVVIRIQEKFKGLDFNSVSGLTNKVKSLYPTLVWDVHIVRPTDRIEFRRITSSPSLDLYISGDNILSFTESYLAVGGERVVSLSENRTVTSITEVAVGGTVLDLADWTYVPDTSLEFQLSTRANPKIQLINPLATNELVEITGTKNQLLDDLQTSFLPSEDALFQTDILIRGFIPLPIQVVMEIKLSSGDPDEVKGTTEGLLFQIIQPKEVPSMLVPETIKELIKGTLPQISSLKITKFKRTKSSLRDVEIVIPQKNQIPQYDTLTSSITVRL